MMPVTSQRMARVLVDVTGIGKTFDYLVPAEPDAVAVGTEVRVGLGGRNVRGWITELDVVAPEGVQPRPVRRIRGTGPAAELIDLAHWAARRWVGHPAQLLRIASAPATVHGLPDPAGRSGPADAGADDTMVVDVLETPASVVRLPPAHDRTAFMVGLLARAVGTSEVGSALVVCPTLESARRLVPRLRQAGFPVADLAIEGPATLRATAWAQAAAGGSVVVGTRNSAWAPAPAAAVMVIVDEHDEAHQSTRMPTWHARDVLAERAARAGVPFVQLSPCPTLEALARSRLFVPARGVERDGWPGLEIVDRGEEDPRTATSVLSEQLGTMLRRPGRMVCVLNRTGRARLLACRPCGALARCERCGAAVGAPDGADLVCPRCAATRPKVCLSCGSGAFKVLRIGVSRAREELEALVGEPVAEVSATTDPGTIDERVIIGTEAVLHRMGTVAGVVFLDIDGELTAPRFRAPEQAMTLLARAARLLGPRTRGNHLAVQTRMPDHPVLDAVAHADPGRLAESERGVRQALAFPPFAALALISGPGADEFATGVDRGDGEVEVMGSGDGRWLIRAPDHDRLSDVLTAHPRPSERVRVEVDPLRV